MGRRNAPRERFTKKGNARRKTEGHQGGYLTSEKKKVPLECNEQLDIIRTHL